MILMTVTIMLITVTTIPMILTAISITKLRTSRHIFHLYHLPKYRKFSECIHSGKRRTATRFDSTMSLLYKIMQIFQSLSKRIYIILLISSCWPNKWKAIPNVLLCSYQVLSGMSCPNFIQRRNILSKHNSRHDNGKHIPWVYRIERQSISNLASLRKWSNSNKHIRKGSVMIKINDKILNNIVNLEQSGYNILK